MADVVAAIESVVNLAEKLYDYVQRVKEQHEKDQALVDACTNQLAFGEAIGRLKDFKDAAAKLGGQEQQKLQGKLDRLAKALADNTHKVEQALLRVTPPSRVKTNKPRQDALKEIQANLTDLDSKWAAFDDWFKGLYLRVLDTKIKMDDIDIKKQDQSDHIAKRVQSWEAGYKQIKESMGVVRAWRKEFGPYYAVAVFKNPALLPEAVAIRGELETYWRNIQGHCERNNILADDFFSSGNWFRRATEYRYAAEQLDIANWYYREKNFDDEVVPDIKGNHYITGTDPLDGPDREFMYDAVGQVAGVKDNRARPGRFKLIQERELAALKAERKDLSKGSPVLAALDTLGLARLLKNMGTGAMQGTNFKTADISSWPTVVQEELKKAREAELQRQDDIKIL